jgi:glycosyltransferase involved in cell wall biosynthesis
MSTPKTFIVSSYIPSENIGGTSTVITRLLENLPPDRVMVAGATGKVRRENNEYPVLRLLPKPTRGQHILPLILAPLNAILVLWTIRRFKPDVIVGIFPDDATLLTAYLVHRLSGVPLISYFCDLYLESGSWLNSVAKWLQPEVFRASKVVIVVNEAMAEYYEQRYQQHAEIVPTAINLPIFKPFASGKSDNDQFTIAFSGQVNEGRVEGLKLLLEAIGNDPAYKVKLFTPTSREKLKQMGVWHDRMELEQFSDVQQLLTALAACDVMYLPLIFKSAHISQDQLATAFGIKAYDYMLTGRPTVVFAPTHFFTAQFFLRANAAIVVGERSAAALYQGFETLRHDAALQAKLGQNAFELAKQFDSRVITHHFSSILQRIYN